MNFSTFQYRYKSLSTAFLISRYILGLGQRRRCCFCAACPIRKMYLEIRSANEGAYNFSERKSICCILLQKKHSPFLSPFQLQITASVRELPLLARWAKTAAPTLPAAAVREPMLFFVIEGALNLRAKGTLNYISLASY